MLRRRLRAFLYCRQGNAGQYSFDKRERGTYLLVGGIEINQQEWKILVLIKVRVK